MSDFISTSFNKQDLLTRIDKISGQVQNLMTFGETLTNKDYFENVSNRLTEIGGEVLKAESLAELRDAMNNLILLRDSFSRLLQDCVKDIADDIKKADSAISEYVPFQLRTETKSKTKKSSK